MSSSLPSIYFVFPYREVGGVSTLFLRIATYLAAQRMAKTYLVDYRDGFMANHRDVDLVGLVEYQDNTSVTIPKDAIAVFQSMTPWSIFPALVLHENTRIFFWNCYPFNLVPLLPGFRSAMQNYPKIGRLVLNSVLFAYKQKMRRFIQLLTDCNALAFMDSENMRVTVNYLGPLKLTEKYLPIPIEEPVEESRKEIVNLNETPDEIRLAWIGRIADFKHHILARTIERINTYQPQIGKNLKFYIVGSGKYLDNIKSIAESHENVSYHFVDHIEPMELNDFIEKNIDIVFAMGTSALQAARLGIPVVLVDFSYKKVNRNYRFAWFYERTGYSLGESISDQHLDGTNDSILLRLQEFIRDPALQSERTLNYTRCHHSLPVVAELLMEQLQHCTCTWAMMTDARMHKRGIVYRGFSQCRKFLRSMTTE